MAARSAEEIARAFIAGSEEGALPDDLVKPGMVAWTTLQAEHSLERYRGSIAWMRAATEGTLKFTIDAVTVEAERIVIEANSTARLRNGVPYSNTYVFVLRTEDGRIASVREHFNAKVVIDKLIPLMSAG